MNNPPPERCRSLVAADIEGPLLLWTLALSLPIAGIALSWDMQLSLGITLGALLSMANTMLLARAISSTLSRISEQAEQDPGKIEKQTSKSLSLLFRMPLVILALLGILWYMPARLEGLALGMVLALIATAITIFRGRQPAPTTHET